RVDFSALTLRALDATEVASRALERAGAPSELLEVASGSTSFQADPTLVARALANLLENAVKHGTALRPLPLPGTASPVVIEVEDSGKGFAPGEETKIFDPFYRHPGSDRGTLGLGLALVKRIALDHGGSVYAENRREGGARVVLELPLAPSTDSQTDSQTG